MKREDLTKLGVDEKLLDEIMALHGKDIEGHKTRLETAETELSNFKAQLEAANKQIKAFEGAKTPQEVEAMIGDWKAQLEKARTEANANLKQLKFDHALEAALTGAKAKNTKAVTALLDVTPLKLQEDGSIFGLNDQLTKVKSENPYLFESDEKQPRVIAGINNPPPMTDPKVDSLRKAFGLPVQKAANS